MIVTVTNDNFGAEVLDAPIPVLTDFWAPWCGPCKMVSAVLDEIAEEYDGKLKICTINVAEEEALAEKHEVVSIPTLIVYQDGRPVRRQVGAPPKYIIESLFQDLVEETT